MVGEPYQFRHHTGLNDGPAIQGVGAPEIATWDYVSSTTLNSRVLD